jgi:hypothetical protein
MYNLARARPLANAFRAAVGTPTPLQVQKASATACIHGNWEVETDML